MGLFTYFSSSKKLNYLENLFCRILHIFQTFPKSSLTQKMHRHDGFKRKKLVFTYFNMRLCFVSISRRTHMATTDLELTNIDSHRNNHITQTICDIVNYEKFLAQEGFDPTWSIVAFCM